MRRTRTLRFVDTAQTKNDLGRFRRKTMDHERNKIERLLRDLSRNLRVDRAELTARKRVGVIVHHTPSTAGRRHYSESRLLARGGVATITE